MDTWCWCSVRVSKKGSSSCRSRIAQLISAEVSIPSGQGGVEALAYIRLAFGRWYLVFWWVVRHGFWGGWLVFFRKACNMGPKRPCGSIVKGMRTMFLL